MKLSLKTFYYSIAITVIYIISTAVAGILKINHVPINNVAGYIGNFIIEGAYILMILCLTSVLKLTGEKSAVITGFGIYIVCDGIIFIIRTFFFGFSVLNGNMVLNAISFAATLYFILQTFRVKQTDFSGLFKTLGLAILLSFVFKAIAAMLLIMHWTGKSMLSYMVIANLIPSIVILVIFYKALRRLKMELI